MDSVLDLVLAGDYEIYDLSQPMEYGMPRAPVHPEFRMTLVRRHGDAYRPDGTSASSELIITGGHVGTHIDALAHFSHDGKLYGGIDAAEAQQTGRFTSRGIDEIVPRITRGILLDVPKHLDQEILPGGYGITAELLKEVASACDLQVNEGDVVFVRTGWSKNYNDVTAYRGWKTGVPGVTEDAAIWLADEGAWATGSDTINYEQILPQKGSEVLPVHRALLVERGVYILEICDLEPISEAGVNEFAIVIAPLNVVGATGAPMRLLALADKR